MPAKRDETGHDFQSDMAGTLGLGPLDESRDVNAAFGVITGDCAGCECGDGDRSRQRAAFVLRQLHEFEGKPRNRRL